MWTGIMHFDVTVLSPRAYPCCSSKAFVARIAHSRNACIVQSEVVRNLLKRQEILRDR